MTFRNFRFALEFAPVWVADKILGILPRPLCLAGGERLGQVVGFFAASRNRLMRANLERVFPNKSKQEREQIRGRVWKNIGRVAAEFIRMSEIKSPNFWDFFRIENEDLLRRAEAKGKGIILVGFHFTNWELTGVAGRFLHGNLVAVARPIKNPLVDRWVQKKRGLGGMDIISHRSAVRGSLKALKENKAVGILVDQNLYTGGIFAGFLGRPAATTTLPALLHNRTGAPILLLYCVRDKDKIRIVFEDAPPVTTNSDSGDALVPLTQALNDRLSEIIRAHPENWFWVHNRWKRQPES